MLPNRSLSSTPKSSPVKIGGKSFMFLLLGIGGVLDNMKGWREIYTSIHQVFSASSIIQFFVEGAREIILIYKDIVNWLLFWLPDGIREHVMLVIFLLTPLGLSYLKLTKKFDSRDFELRFVLVTAILWFAIDINDYFYGRTGVGRNIAWGLGWTFIIYFSTLFYLPHKKRFWVIVFCLFWSMFWIAGNAHSSASERFNPTEQLFWTYPAILLLGAYFFKLYAENKRASIERSEEASP